MKFTLSWLKDHLDTTATADEIAEKLTAIGLEVESVEDPAKTLEGFKVGYVKDAVQHPNADRLRVCQVDVGDGALKNIVCGAPNARTGIKIAFAPIGAYIPGIDVTLKKAEIRGVPSEGMMCSERELCLSDEHNGIIELPETAEVGTDLAPALGLNDPIFDVAITPNRGDCAGVLGIARDLAAAGLGTLKPLKPLALKATFKSPVTVTIKDDAKQACPLFIGRMIKGVKNGPSPEWLQKRLRAVGLRPISALVDITNYFSIGLCRPLHVFDADTLKGDIHVRMGQKGEKLEALNEKTYELDETMVAICDDSGVLALGGVMGGTRSGCTDATVNVYLECAYFDPLTIAKTGQALQITSDARYRFERGIDPAFTAAAAELATQMILDLCGGEASELVTAGAEPDNRVTFPFDPARTEKLCGVVIPTERQIAILESLGFTVTAKGKTYEVTSPTWRHDIQGSADFIEEIVRIHGYDKIEPVSVTRGEFRIEPALTPAKKAQQTARRLLAARGLEECVTWSFMPSSKVDLFGGVPDTLKIANPISTEMDVMRPSIIPNLIEAAARNHDKGFPNGTFFEIGPVFRNETLVKGQEIAITGLRCGWAVDKHWSQTRREVDAFDVKADILAALNSYIPGLQPQLTTDAPAWFHPGKSGVLRMGKNEIGVFGALHPAILEAYDIDYPVVAFELFVDRLPAAKNKAGKARPPLFLNPLQPLTRDFAFIVPHNVRADDVMRVVAGVDKNMIADVRLFDVYEGQNLGEGQKSLAISVTIQPQDKTLSEQDIEAISTRIVKAVGDKTGGTLRS